MRPPSGSMVHWRFKDTRPWHFGYVTYEGELLRMGRWNGDNMGGTLVSPSEINWLPYTT